MVSETITYLNSEELIPHFMEGDCLEILSQLPAECIDCCITSPPYWGQRSYDAGGIGLENSPEDFIKNLLEIIAQVKSVLKPTGSFWLNIGDTYREKSLQGIPWRIALRMMDEQGWTLRNSIIWNKHKGGMDSSKDRLRNIHEHFFHFVKNPKDYYYDADAIRSNPRKTTVKKGVVISATGVSGVSYKRKIEMSTALSEKEKQKAFKALEEVLQKMQDGEISDFRMIIRGSHRTTHSDSEKVSGRAKELNGKGFYFLFYHPKGALPTDVWDIIPEDTQNRIKHFAPFPEDICRIPILSTCPENGLVLDPFCGTGTANKVACELGRKSIGIDLSREYIRLAESRMNQLQPVL